MTNAQLVFVNNNKEVVTDSLLISEMFDKQHAHVMRDIQTQMDYAGEEFSLSNFGESEYKNGRGKTYSKFDLTEEAFTLVVMGYNTREAVQMKIKFIQEFKRMKGYIQSQEQPKTAIGEIEQLLMRGAVELNKRVDVLEEKIETKITIDYQQQRIMQNTVETTVRHLWDNGTSHGYFTKRQLFSKAHRRLKDRYGVSSYKDILSKDFEEAVNYMRNWKGE